MCAPAVAALPAIAGVSATTWLPMALGAGLSYAGSVRQANAADAAMASQLQQKNLGIMQQTEANNRVAAATQAANAAQLGIDRDRMSQFMAGVQQVNTGNTKKDMDKSVGKETGKLKGALKASVERGEQTASSGVQGNLSESYGEAESRAVEKSGNKADRLAGQVGTIGGSKAMGITQQRKLGDMNASLAAFGPRARGQAALDRLNIARAGMTPPELTQVVNTGSTSGDIMGALGRAMMMYGGSMFGGQPQLLGPSGTGNPFGPGSGMAASRSVWG